MLKRLGVMCLWVYISLCSMVLAAPVAPTYAEQTLDNPIDGGFLLQKTATGAIAVPHNYPLVVQFSVYYQENEFYFGDISLLQFNKKPPVDIKQVILLSDFRTIELPDKDHKRDTGLEYTTDAFMIPSSLGGNLKGFFRLPSSKIVLRIIDNKNMLHDYFLDMDFIEQIKKTLL